MQLRDSLNLSKLFVALLIPMAMAVGTFFTVQADLRSLEGRMTQDEARLYNVEERLRAQEQDSGARLARIETLLESMQAYMYAISERLDVQPRGMGGP